MDIVNKVIQIRIRKIVFIFLCITALPCGWCTEEYQREIYLGPRNFNPHPYEHQLARIQDPGPVTFPRTEDEEDTDINNRYNIVTVDSKRFKLPVDDHPYSKVVEKVKYLSRKKYNNNVANRIDPEIYDALAEQGTKVLSYPPQDVKNFGGPSHLQKKNYAFAYKVLDKSSGDDFSHQQIRNSKATNGEYRVKLPDGRIQIVSYKADKDGYKADVRYEHDPEFTYQNLIHGTDIENIPRYAEPQHVDVQRVPVRQLRPRGRIAGSNGYDYAAEEGEQQLVSPLRDSNVVVLEQSGPTPLPIKYVDVTPSPSPVGYFNGAGNHQFQVPHHYPNVQIYTTNSREQGGYVPSTAATPTHEKGVIRYTSTPIPPVQAQVGHIGDHGLFIPVISSTYAPVARQPAAGNYKNVISRPDVSGRVGGSVYHQTLAQEDELPEGIYIVGKSGKRK